RDVDGDHLVEALRECSRHPPRATAHFEAASAPRVGTEPPEQARQLVDATGRVADVHRGITGSEGVPRAAHFPARQRVACGPADPCGETVSLSSHPSLRDWGTALGARGVRTASSSGSGGTILAPWSPPTSALAGRTRSRSRPGAAPTRLAPSATG